MSVEIEGMNELISKLKGFVAEAPDLFKAVTKANAEQVMFISQPITPVDTGALQDAYTVGNVTVSGSTYECETTNDVTGERGRNYTAAQEYGWHDRSGKFHQGRFFMQTGAKITQDTIAQDLKEEVSKKI